MCLRGTILDWSRMMIYDGEKWIIVLEECISIPLTNVLEGCICQYIRLLSILEGCISQYSKFIILWNIVFVLLCSPHGPSVFHLHGLISKKPPFQLYRNTILTYFLFVCSFERDNIEHFCGEILSQSSDASEVQPPEIL